MTEGLQGQKAKPSHSVVTESLKEEVRYLGNENLTKITDNKQNYRKLISSIYFASTKLIRY